MLFLGLGTGLGSAMIVDGIVQPMELAHLPYKKRTYEDYVGLRGLEEFGKKAWRKHVEQIVERLVSALEPDDVVLGGGNAKAFVGGFRAWESADRQKGGEAAPHRLPEEWAFRSPACRAAHLEGAQRAL